MAGAWRAYLTGGDAAYIKSLGGDTAPVERGWGPAQVNNPSWGSAWTSSGVLLDASEHTTPVPVALTSPGSSYIEDLEPWSAEVYQVSVPNGLVTVSVQGGYAAIHDTGGLNLTGTDYTVFCVGAASCMASDVTCTSGGAPVNLTPLGNSFTLAASSTEGGAHLTVTTTKAPSNPTTPTAVPAPGGASSCSKLAEPSTGTDVGYSEGDPHVGTLSGGALDFQAAGEYTLVESKDRSVDVQVRQEPIKPSSAVAEDTAVAMLVGGTRLEVDAGNPPVLLDNGEVTHLRGTSPTTLPGGGSVRVDDEGDVFVKWPNGCTAAIETFTGGLSVFFGAPKHLAGDMRGLLNAVATGGSPLATRIELIGGNGRHYFVDPTTMSGFRVIYRVFAPTWAVTRRSSLFTYPAGRGPSSYLVTGFPSRNADAAPIPAGMLGFYESSCRADGVKNGNLLRGCEIDAANLGAKELDFVLRLIVRAVGLYALTEGRTPGSTTPPTPVTSVPVSPVTVAPPVSGGSTLPTDVSTATIGSIRAHPCILLTHAQADAAAITRFPAAYEIPKTGLCEYSASSGTGPSINVFVEYGTVTQSLPPKDLGNTFVPEPALGAAVVWVVEKGSPPGSGELFFPLGKVGSTSYTIQIAVDRGGLIEVSKIARDCFSHL
jgi:hypothetical protein